MKNPLLATLALALLAAPSRADTLEAALRALVRDVKALLKGKEQALTLAAIGPHPESHVALHSSGGTVIAHDLRRLLAEAKIEVKRGSDVTLSGTFREVEDLAGRQAVEIELRLFDRVTGKRNELAAAYVKNEPTVLHLLGLPAHFDSGKEADRARKIKDEVDKHVPAKRKEKPKALLDGDLVRAGPGSPFAIGVRVAKKSKAGPEEYEARRPADDAGFAFAGIARDEVYAVQLVNDAAFDAAVSLRIDGLSMFVTADKKFRDPKTGRPKFNHVLVPAGSSVLVRGWFVTLDETDEFKVTAYSKSVAAEVGLPATPGTITATFHAAVPASQDFPPGEPEEKKNAFDASFTGRGARIGVKYTVKEGLKIGGVRGSAAIRYERVR